MSTIINLLFKYDQLRKENERLKEQVKLLLEEIEDLKYRQWESDMGDDL